MPLHYLFSLPVLTTCSDCMCSLAATEFEEDEPIVVEPTDVVRGQCVSILFSDVGWQEGYVAEHDAMGKSLVKFDDGLTKWVNLKRSPPWASNS